MKRSDITRAALTDMVFALKADRWTIRLVPDDDTNAKVIPIHYTRAQLIGATGYLRSMNRSGFHVYGRPDDARHVLIDDLDDDALAQLRADDLRPVAVVMTSKANYQAWLTASHEPMEHELARSVSRLLARRYDGDPGSVGSMHLGRLPGFTNRKDIYGRDGVYPWTRLLGNVVPGVRKGVARLLEEARESHHAGNFPSSTLGAGAPNGIMPNTAMTPDDAAAIYSGTVRELTEGRGWRLPNADRSIIDFHVARHLAFTGFDDAEIAAVLQHASAKAHERGADYIARTVAAARHR